MPDQPQPSPADLPPELLEQVAKIIAPHLEGGREFDQMPPDRVALRKWCREGMCSTNDATQDDAIEIAHAVAPLLIAHGRELEKAMQEAANDALDVINDMLASISVSEERMRSVGGKLAHAIERNEYRSKP